MKHILQFISISILTCVLCIQSSCQQPLEEAGSLTISLIPGEEKSPFAAAYSLIRATDASEGNPWAKTLQKTTNIPDSLLDVKVYDQNLQIHQLVYYAYKSSLIDSIFYESWISNVEYDESLYTTDFVDQQVHFALGRDADSNFVLIFDTDNDESFRNEESYLLSKDVASKDWMNQEMLLPVVEVEYELFDGHELRKTTERLRVNPFQTYMPGTVMIGKASYNQGELTYKGQAYAWWLGNMSPGAAVGSQARVWFEPLLVGENAFPIRPRTQEELLTEALSEALDLPEGYFPTLPQPYEIQDRVKLGDDYFLLAKVSPEGNELILKPTHADNTGLRKGNSAPLFTGNSLDSTLIGLSDYRGKYVLIDFWGVWCAPCLDEVSFLLEAYNAYPRDRFDILAVAFDEHERLEEFVEEKGLPWKQLLQPMENDATNKVLELYRIDSYPTTFLLNPEGIIVGREVELRGDELMKTLKQFLGEPT